VGSSCHIRKRLISLIGVKDIVIVDTPDALLVTTAAHAQRVKDIVEQIRQSGDDALLAVTQNSSKNFGKATIQGCFYGFTPEIYCFARRDNMMGTFVVPVRDPLDWDHTIQ